MTDDGSSDARRRSLGGRYEVGEVIGRGGMAEVHLGRDLRLGRTVAVKLLRSDLARDPSFQARFRREAQSAAVAEPPEHRRRLRHRRGPMSTATPACRRAVHRHGVRRGRDAARRRAAPGPQLMPRAGRSRSDRGMLAALDYSHRHGIVHRDIKPGNVMLTPTGTVKVMDFGIARAVADSAATMTQTSAVLGTAQYLSPEQARGETGRRPQRPLLDRLPALRAAHRSRRRSPVTRRCRSPTSTSASTPIAAVAARRRPPRRPTTRWS